MEILQPFIKWSGGKRSQSKKIVSFFPKEIKTYFEPFLGGGAITGYLKPINAILGDINKPLIDLWKLIRDNPASVIKAYRKDWITLQENGIEYFYKVRSRFNKNQKPTDLMFLSRTCVNGLIRYNNSGEFNNSFHLTRKGMNPIRLGNIIYEWHELIKNYDIRVSDYKETTRKASEKDFIYLDPPYFNNYNRYFGEINFEEFMEYLYELNRRKINYALSYDGLRGINKLTVNLPKSLYKNHIFLRSGNSTFNKVLNNKLEKVYESIYTNY